MKTEYIDSLRKLKTIKKPTTIIFTENFNESIPADSLPSSATSLRFGWDFNKTLNVGVIPSNVTHLVLGYNFNRPLKVGAIPSSVTQLTFGFCFDQPLNVGAIPSSVTHLTLGEWFNKPIKVGVLQEGLKQLVFKGKYDFKQAVFPASLQWLEVDGKVICRSALDVALFKGDMTRAVDLLFKGANLTHENIEALKNIKPALFEAIKKISSVTERNLAIQQSLDKKTPLGRVFFSERGFHKCTLKRGTLRKIYDYLIKHNIIGVAILSAADTNNLKAVRALITQAKKIGLFDDDKDLLNRDCHSSTENYALHSAAQHGNKDMVLLLVMYGANPDQKNKAGDTTRKFVSTCQMKSQQDQVTDIRLGSPANFFNFKSLPVEKNAKIPIVNRKVMNVQADIINNQFYLL